MLNLSNEQFKVGMYIRLSREDGDKQESESIGNQRNIIKRFLEENNLGFVDEYVDDGVSGTTFDRKGFNRLIEDIESKRINMVVTKDLSRLGRDYIKTGYYLENYFPEKNVRYVAILDGIDTYLDSTNNDISPFKAIMNDMYAKDTSKYTRHEYLFKGLLKYYHCGWNLQIALKGRGMNPYINCIGHEKRGRHPISMNYWNFEESILEVIRNICKMYLDEKTFIEVYKKYKNNYINLMDEYQKKLNEIENKAQNINSNIDKMYMDKLNGIISTDDYMRFYNRFSEEKKDLLEKQFELKQKIRTIKEKEEETIDESKVKQIINEFLNMKEVDKVLLYRLINYIEIDTDKNIYIHFNFNQLNIISDSMSINDGKVEYKEILKTG